jgi:superfamily II DNA or RNA helicase
MKSVLREYQQEIYDSVRELLRTNRSVLVQSATGSGKSVIITAICESVFLKGKRIWIIVNRKELLSQMSKHLRKWNLPHGIIDPKNNESRAYNVHLISKDTLIRRYGKIKNFPDLIIFDEAHLFLKRQIEIVSHLPEKCKIIGFTATPERLSGEGLSTSSGGLYDVMYESHSIPWLTDRGFLTPLIYYAPPLEGLRDLKFKGTDIDEEQLEELLQRRKIYGQVVDHFRKHGKGKSALIFCRSIKQAEQTAERFRDNGFLFYNIDSTMSSSKREELVNDLTSGKIHGLTGVDIFTYGVDIPRIEYAATIRPTLSRASYMQSIGRALRPWKDPVTGYEKKEALFFDHVNNILEHQDENYPGMPLHYAPEIKWNFDGTEKRKRNKAIRDVRMCPYKDFMYCSKPSCATCEFNPDKSVTDARKPMIIIPTELEAVAKPIEFSNLPPEERREIQDEIGSAVMEYKTNMSPGAIGKLLQIGEKLGYKPLWVYYKLTEENRYTVNFPLLHEIARQKNFKTGWCHFAAQKIRQKKGA